MAIKIVDFPIKNGGSFHSYVKLPEGIYRPFFSRQDEEDAEQTDVPEERSGEVTLNAESEEAWSEVF